MIVNNFDGAIQLDYSEKNINIANSDIIIYERNNNEYDLCFNIENSNVKYFAYDMASVLKISRVFNIKKNSNVEIVFGHFGYGNVNTIINLLEPNANAAIKTVSICNESSLNINLEINHLSPDTTGINENYAVSKNSIIKYDIIGKISKGMKRSKCSQKTRGIVIENGMVEADPALLIDEYDVSANHGACIGKISDEGLFYLMSRGITKDEALLLIVNGYLNCIYNLLIDEAFKEEFIKASKLKME